MPERGSWYSGKKHHGFWKQGSRTNGPQLHYFLWGLEVGCLNVQSLHFPASKNGGNNIYSWAVTTNENKVSLGDDENALKIDYGDNCTTLEIY